MKRKIILYFVLVVFTAVITASVVTLAVNGESGSGGNESFIRTSESNNTDNFDNMEDDIFDDDWAGAGQAADGKVFCGDYSLISSESETFSEAFGQSDGEADGSEDREYTITLDLGGGGWMEESYTAVFGEIVEELQVQPIKENCEFWYWEDENGQLYDPDMPYPYHRDLTLKAIYKSI